MTAEVADDDLETMPLKKVALSLQESDMLYNADPHSKEVKDFLKSHEIEFGDKVEVELTMPDHTTETIIVTADEHDFWTLLAEDTKAINEGVNPFVKLSSEHAANINGDLQAQSPELETPPEGVVDELGQTAVEEVALEGGEYGYLFVEETEGEAQQYLDRTAKDERLDQRLAALYPPLVRPAAGPAPEVWGQYVPSTPEDIKRKYYDRFITEENHLAAEKRLSALSGNAEAKKLMKAIGISDDLSSAVDTIRQNPEVRVALARYFTRKLDDLITQGRGGFGDRIIANSPGSLKNDQIMPGKKMLSREHVVDLVLKMLDGEFSDQISASDKIELIDGKAVVGQHRHAADVLLKSYH